MSRLPIVDKDLIEYLEEVFPNEAPSLDTPEREIWAKVGEVQVVRHLRSIYDEQQDNILDT